MTTPSPSDFLTLSRRVLVPLSRTLAHHHASYSMIAPRSLHSIRYYSSGKDSPGLGKEHVLDKSTHDTHNIHSKASAEGQQDRNKQNGTGGSATTGADQRNSTAKAKKDHPEAPDVIIGMQDERGAKGH
ncbi:hypothetical protein EJ05DRAFT_510303 [Pseudovirgaria hyperparasitica]|uniref:Uncharacterized protein n=1 Tax=Pseudovirgaria hyperparasitica TaxID=470096 RepID=A0A6A6W9V1_9PEZI|nr:uncharacterized protein EJ05DRAFT_510303 [Pseudovirgaria hyperparasitica]KAF2758367.1 hypothetical protein EJ05DRAFT_510303 [Pseudovirgaria hyperparasitica]